MTISSLVAGPTNHRLWQTSKRCFTLVRQRTGTGNQRWRMYNRQRPALRLKELILPHIDKPTCQFLPPILRHHEAHPSHPAPFLSPLDESDPTPDKFCIFAPWEYRNIQWKCMEGDRLMLDHLVDPRTLRVYQLDEDVVFTNVMLVANREKTLIGRPLIPFCKVICRVEQVLQLPRRLWVRKFRRMRRVLKRGHRKWVTIVKVKKILCDLDMWENMPHDQEFQMWDASLKARNQALVNEVIRVDDRFLVDPQKLNWSPQDLLDTPVDKHFNFENNSEIEDISQVR